MTEILLWAGYFAVFAFLVHRGAARTPCSAAP